MERYDRWTAMVSAGLVFGALLACKKKQEATDEASASAVVAAPPPPVPTATAAPTETLKLGDVKRYADKEKKSDESAVRVLADEVKIFNEADSKSPEVATLPKDALVFRLAEVDDFQLVEFPSGIGQFSQGWVEKKSLSDKPVMVAREVVLKEEKTATLKVDAGAPSPSASASAAKFVATSASAVLTASASAVPAASAAATPASSAPPAETDAERRIREAEERAREAEKRARAAERKAKEAAKKAKEAAQAP